MKAISIRQPYASLILCGAKKWEFREFSTEPQRLLVHVSKSSTEEERLAAYHPEARKALRAAGHHSFGTLPRGVLLGSVDVVRCWPVEEVLEAAGEEGIESWLLEIAGAHWREAKYAWELAEPRLLPKPIVRKGQPGLFNVAISQRELGREVVHA